MQLSRYAGQHFELSLVADGAYYTVTQLLASLHLSVHLSVHLSLMLCIMVLNVGIDG